MKKKDYRNGVPSRISKVEIGFRLLFLGAMVCTLNVVGLAVALFAPFATMAGNMATANIGIKIAMKDLFSTKGMTGDQKDLIRALNDQLQEVEVDEDIFIKAGFVKATDLKKDINTRIVEALKGLITEDKDGKINFAIELDRIKSLLGENEKDEKGIYNIVKKLGENVTQMQEKSTKAAFGGLEEALKKNMPELEKLFKTKKGSFDISFKAATIQTVSTAVDVNDDLPADFIESFSVGAFVPKRFPREYVFDMASRTTVAEVAENKIWLEEGDVQGGFAVVAEGGLKPLVSGQIVRNFSVAKKIAARWKYTEEFAKFRKQAFAIIRRMVNQKLLRDYAAILTVDLLADAAPYVASALDGTVPALKVTDYHAIAAVAAQIESIDFVPDMLIMNPGDKWRIGMSQDANGQFYLQIPTTDPSGTTRIMGFVLRTSNRIPLDTFILGEAGLWEIEDEAITVRTGYGITVTGGTDNGGGNVTNVQSDLESNRFTVIVETFFHDYIASNNEGSFVKATFSAVKEAVTV